MKKVSVIVPAYNCEKYINRCIDALIGQTYENIEIIAVNDGSSDGTLEKLLEYGDKIKVIDKQNGGAASARNAGLDAAKGDFIMFCDSDDFYDKEAVSFLSGCAEEHEADIVRSGYRLIYTDGSEGLPKNRFTEPEVIQKGDFKEKVYSYFIDGIMLNTTCGVIYRKSVVENLRFRTDMKTGEDAAFNIEAFTNAQTVIYAPDIFYNYVQVQGSLTGSALGISEKYRCNFELSKIMLKKLTEWDMDNIFYRIKTALRPIRLTLDKLTRLRK